MKILDATAGWGRDAAILASFGAEICMLERNPIMAILLEDALAQRSLMDSQKLSLSLIHTNAFDYLSSLQEYDYPDVIYVDPMHPERTQSALVKKEMQALQQLIGEDKDAKALIEVARSRMKMRLVVKWPQKLPPLLKPDISIPGKTIRYDIYLALGS